MKRWYSFKRVEIHSSAKQFVGARAEKCLSFHIYDDFFSLQTSFQEYHQVSNSLDPE